MSKADKDLQQRFDELPDAEPAFGLDTRIKALARAQQEQQRNMHSTRKRWSAGLATVACAGLVFVIAKPLMQAPSHRNTSFDTSVQSNSTPTLETEVTGDIQLNEPAASVQRKSSAGGGAKPTETQDSKTLNAHKRAFSAPAPAASVVGRSNDHAQESLSQFDEQTDDLQAIPSLQHLLQKLEYHRLNKEFEQAVEVQKILLQHYPNYGTSTAKEAAKD